MMAISGPHFLDTDHRAAKRSAAPSGARDDEGQVLADQQQISVSPVNDKAGLKAFVEIGYELNASDPAWVPPLRAEVYEMFNPAKNPF